MALKISELNGMFHLHGKINTTTLNSFVTYFEYKKSHYKNIVVNIDHVLEIDKCGLEAFRKFTIDAISNQKVFSIVGYGCKEIYEDFNETIVA